MGDDKDSTELEFWERPIIIVNKTMSCSKCKMPLVATGRKVKCKHCGETCVNRRFTNYVTMLVELFQYTHILTVHVLRVHTAYADSIIDMFKRSFHVQENYRKPVTTTNDRTGEELRVMEIELEKYVR